MSIGSPAHTTYNLALTIQNRRWIRQLFEKLYTLSKEIPGATSILHHKLLAARTLAQGGQQVSLRASQEDAWLSSLIILLQNDDWWKRVRRDLRNTRRGITPSLVAQLLVAFIAYIFTIVNAFKVDLGGTETALDMSAGTVWVWMLPVIMGWIAGIQKQPVNSTKCFRLTLCQ